MEWYYIIGGIIVLIIAILWNNQNQQGGGQLPQQNDAGGFIAAYGIGARGGFGVGAPGDPDEADTEYLVRDNYGRLVGTQRQKIRRQGAANQQNQNGQPAGNNGGNPVPNVPAGGGNGGPAAP